MKKFFYLILFAILAMGLVSCSKDSSNPKTEEKTIENKKEESKESNNEEEKEAENLKTTEQTDEDAEENRIVSISPPIYSMLCQMGLKDQVVGASPLTFGNANEKVHAEINPNYKSIQTQFITPDFKVNKESLLSLDPTIILLYGKFQDEGLSELKVPVENLKIQSMSAEDINIFWENELAKILNIENSKKMENAWKKTHEILNDVNKEHKLKGLYLFSNIKGIMVSGGNSYGDNFMNLVGIENVAKDVAGFKEGAGQIEISMEQINEWNPDIIFVGVGASAKDMIDGNVPNQNWSNIEAVKNRKVYDIPNGIFSWGMPCGDSPLMPIWMASCVDDQLISNEDMKDMVRKYYKDMYDTDITDETLESIFNYKN
ncbi:MAG: ABC transporter substrate-binding protein [Tissierellia bacterium]|nr:ABC transporter substrate-binding protein [Tissierellia bacterium]